MRVEINRLKRLSLPLVLVVMLSGCGIQNDPGKDGVLPAVALTGYWSPENLSGLDQVTLKMYLVGDKSKDFDLVYDKLNQMLKADINATVEVSFLGWGDYLQKYPLLFASGEDFDLIYTSNWALYNSQAMKGGFLEITQDMLDKYAPRTAKTIFKQAWEQAKVNGRVYMLPMNYKELNDYVYLVRGDLMDKYGMGDIKNENDFEQYLDVVSKNEKTLIPLDIGSDYDFSSLLRFEVLAPNNLDYLEPHTLNHLYNLSNSSPGEVYNIVEMPEFLEFAGKMQDWNRRGFWLKSALVNKVSVKDSFISGKSASAVLNLATANSIYMSVTANHPEWNVRIYDGMNGKGVSIKPFIQNGMGIYAYSKNQERALMFLDLVRNDRRYADLVTYGIEGVHYEPTSDGKVKPLSGTVNYPIDDNCNWGWRNEDLIREIDGGIPNYGEIRSGWEKIAVYSPVQSFSFDDTQVKNEVAAVSNLWNVDYKVIVMGFTKDTDAEVKALIEKYEVAGSDVVLKEQERQLKEYLAQDLQ